MGSATRSKSKKPRKLPLLTSPNIGRLLLMLTKPDKGLILASKHLQRARPVVAAPLWDHNKYEVISTEQKLLPFFFKDPDVIISTQSYALLLTTINNLLS